MSVSTKTNSKDDSRIGDIVAKQPISGVSIVNRMSIKGSNLTAFVRLEETKKAV